MLLPVAWEQHFFFMELSHTAKTALKDFFCQGFHASGSMPHCTGIEVSR